MDALELERLERIRRTPAGEKLQQALAAMRTGIALKLARLREEHPGDTDAELEARMRRWLARDE